jgi:hypothetical protein
MHIPARLVRCNGVYGVPRASRLPSPSIIKPAGSGLPPAWTMPSTASTATACNTPPMRKSSLPLLYLSLNLCYNIREKVMGRESALP